MTNVHFWDNYHFKCNLHIVAYTAHMTTNKIFQNIRVWCTGHRQQVYFYFLGGALLVSPPKIKNPFQVRKNESPLGNSYSPYRHINGSPQRTNSKVLKTLHDLKHLHVNVHLHNVISALLGFQMSHRP